MSMLDVSWREQWFRPTLTRWVGQRDGHHPHRPLFHTTFLKLNHHPSPQPARDANRDPMAAPGRTEVQSARVLRGGRTRAHETSNPSGLGGIALIVNTPRYVEGCP